MESRSDLTQQAVRDFLDYDPESGVFTWHKRACEKDYGWNAKNAGKEAGTIAPVGYRVVTLCGIKFYCHRLAFLWMTGATPLMVDHIDTDKLNNRWANLRPATRSQNMSNMPKTARNTSGFKGVVWHSQRKRWAAELRVDDTRHRLGLFDTKEEAAAAYKAAAELHFGEFARTD